MTRDVLTMPLKQKQINAAAELYEKLSNWQRKNRLLDNLKECDSDLTDPDMTLLKIAAINQFYYTNLWAVDRMTDHILRLSLMSKLYGSISHVELVEKIAALEPSLLEDPNQIAPPQEGNELVDTDVAYGPPQIESQSVPRKYSSFASKFAHFFISKEDFPIYDSFAESTVGFHLHWQKRTRDEQHPYRAFYANVGRLREWATLSCSFAELDRYLWLAGLYRIYLRREFKGEEPKINQEVKVLFDNNESQKLLKQLFPYVPGEGNSWIPAETV